MSHSLDLRKKVIDYIDQPTAGAARTATQDLVADRGGNISKASNIFGISRASIYRWLNRKDLKPTVVKNRYRKLNWSDLYQDVVRNPDTRLIDRASKFGVRVSAISYALKNLKITRKKLSEESDDESRLRMLTKTKQLRYRERNRKNRIEYLRELRELVKKYGSKALVFIDESGFESEGTCIYAPGEKR